MPPSIHPLRSQYDCRALVHYLATGPGAIPKYATPCSAIRNQFTLHRPLRTSEHLVVIKFSREPSE